MPGYHRRAKQSVWCPACCQPLLAAHPERDHEPSLRSELIQPRGRQVRGTCGHDQPIVRRMVRIAEFAITTDHAHVPIARSRQTPAGAVAEVRVQVDRRHLAGLADQVGKQGRIVTRTSADFQYPVTGLHIQLASIIATIDGCEAALTATPSPSCFV